MDDGRVCISITRPVQFTMQVCTPSRVLQVFGGVVDDLNPGKICC